MAIFCPLYSGSRGNSTLISANNKSILIDIGVSCSKMIKSLTDKIEDINLDDGLILLRETKNKKERIIPIDNTG